MIAVDFTALSFAFAQANRHVPCPFEHVCSNNLGRYCLDPSLRDGGLLTEWQAVSLNIGPDTTLTAQSPITFGRGSNAIVHENHEALSNEIAIAAATYHAADSNVGNRTHRRHRMWSAANCEFTVKDEFAA